MASVLIANINEGETFLRHSPRPYRRRVVVDRATMSGRFMTSWYFYRANGRIPAWADKREMSLIYDVAIILEDQIGVLFEVDHVVPAKGKNVSGLHCQSNLQILPREENRSKYCKFSD